MSIYSALHRFDPDPQTGKCRGGWFNNASDWIDCGSRQRSSVLHDDPDADFREMHSHGGGDCMCFEGEYSWTDALRDYRKRRMEEDPSLREYYQQFDGNSGSY